MPSAVERCLAEGRIIEHSGYSLLVQHDGRECAIRDSVAPILDGQGHVTGTVLVFKDVTQLRGMEREMIYLARHDPLTGLINRREFEKRLQHCLDTAYEDNREHALFYLDLDEFKVVNDTCGHLAGDELLKQVTDPPALAHAQERHLGPPGRRRVRRAARRRPARPRPRARRPPAQRRAPVPLRLAGAHLRGRRLDRPRAHHRRQRRHGPRALRRRRRLLRGQGERAQPDARVPAGRHRARRALRRDAVDLQASTRRSPSTGSAVPAGNPRRSTATAPSHRCARSSSA